MSNAWDGFGDIVDDELGIYANHSALAKIDSIKAKVVRDGVALELYCRGCGKGIVMTLEYPEVVGMQYGLPPQAWIANASTWEVKPDFDVNGQQISAPTWRPQGLQCPCGFHFPIRIALDEPRGWVARAVASNFLPQHAAQQLSQQAMQHAQASGLMQRPPQPQMMPPRR